MALVQRTEWDMALVQSWQETPRLYVTRRLIRVSTIANHGTSSSTNWILSVHSLSSILFLSSYSTIYSTSCRLFFLWSLPTKILYALLIDTMHAKCSTHNLLLRNFIILIISAKEFKLWSSSILSFSIYFDFQCTRSKRSARHFAPLHLHTLHVLV